MNKERDKNEALNRIIKYYFYESNRSSPIISCQTHLQRMCIVNRNLFMGFLKMLIGKL